LAAPLSGSFTSMNTYNPMTSATELTNVNVDSAAPPLPHYTSSTGIAAP